MSLPPFAPNAYYRFSNPQFPNAGISTGYRFETNPPQLGLTPYGSRSSENWQLYAQNTTSGYIYFIRNYDYSGLQLGVSPLQRDVPRMQPRSGALGQQWRITSDGQGKWILSNVLLGPDSVLGVSGGGDRKGFTRDVPAINPGPDGTERWLAVINVSAGEIKAVEDLTDLPLEMAPMAPTLAVKSGAVAGNVAFWIVAAVLLVVAMLFVQYAFVHMLGWVSSKNEALTYVPVADHDELPCYAEKEYDDCAEVGN